MGEEIISLAFKIFLFFSIPSITLLLITAFAKVFFELGSPGLGILTLFGGGLIFCGECYGLYKEAEGILGL